MSVERIAIRVHGIWQDLPRIIRSIFRNTEKRKQPYHSLNVSTGLMLHRVHGASQRRQMRWQMIRRRSLAGESFFMYHRSCMYSKYRVDGGLVGVVVSRLLFLRQLGFFLISF